MHKVLIVTTHKDSLNWKTLSLKLKAIHKVLNTVKNTTFTVQFLYNDVTPEVVNGRITHKWFDSFSYPLYKEGFDFVILHFSGEQKKAWGIDPKLGGSSHTNDGDMVGEAWFWSDEKSVRKGKERFVETCLHEISHLIAKGTKVIDETHAEDKKKNTVTRLFKTYDMSLYLKEEREIEAKKTLLQKLMDTLKTLQFSEKPEPFFKGVFPVTQAFGVANSIYSQTGHHIGTDFGTPLSTLIYAPLSGKLTKSVGKETGTVATLETKQGTYQFLHLGHCAPDGQYEQGHVIGYTGNSGSKTTGPHVCVRLFKGKPDISVLTKDNFRNYLLDVTK